MERQSDPGSINLRDLLDHLGRNPLLRNFRLALYRQGEYLEPARRTAFENCSRQPNQDVSSCGSSCHQVRESTFQKVLASGRPLVFLSPCGTLNLAIPFTIPETSAYCLLAEALPPADLADRLGGAPAPFIAPDLAKAKSIATCIHQQIPGLLRQDLRLANTEKTASRLRTLVDISAEMDLLATEGEIVDLLKESLIILFDLSSLVIVTGDPAASGFILQQSSSWPKTEASPSARKVAEFLRQNPCGKSVSLGEEVNLFFPGKVCHGALAIPLVASGQPLGLVVLPEATLPAGDLSLLELLCVKAASRLHILKLERERLEASAFATRMVTMVSALAQLRQQEEVYRNIVEMSAELLHATCGSLMMLDEKGEFLRIESAKGMNQPLARSLSIKLGTGIAGRVAKNGFPLVVNDIEKDSRLATPNRPRFKTKSFISVPIRIKDRTVGVLNLSDKEDQGIFTENDLHILTSFTAQIAIVLDRAASMERADLLEKLAATDALTGLYNRRFFDERLDSELSRSIRHSLSFSIMLLDLDNFKNYNDLCGHIAGDSALKKVASLLKSSGRDIDVVARFGGEEFIILLPDTSKKEAVLVAERVRHAVESHPFPQEARLPGGQLTTSIGLATFPDDGDFAQALIKAADTALYQAKENGRNRTVPFTRKQAHDNVVFL
ncbi:sensor domain-containing diguanylate cyclase [Desulfuromonas sp. KJ2020]|uniref:sensor domain-containing diguanylate cyclase n=1 Tax=Desulfuromonas sp. KJ2020 TaxID=2919173 RepID=UPI0020A72023|nr:sensor domain-containing diguanylate cyclase [Desulfuromonas sp. KJ2020]MCP3176641.1 sensor domain-containing diguanylate cyclase [Desulfuromonas sp. KJ2020]